MTSSSARNFLLVALGSAGDVHPFVGIGLALRQRGHRVTVLASAYFQPLLERVGLDFEPLGTVEEYLELTRNPHIWHPLKAFHTIMQRGVLPHLQPVYEAVLRHAAQGETVVAGSTLAFGARLAQEKHGLPVATVHLAPALFRSVQAPPRLPGLPMPAWLPHSVRRGMYWLADRLIIDRVLAGPLNEFRAKIGLPPRTRDLLAWWDSPLRVLGLFPQWFAPIQSDWPAQTRLSDFPLYDERGAVQTSDEVAEFLDAGPPPIVFTPGSAMVHGQEFFAAAIDACQRVHRRGLLLTRFPEQLPSTLPPGVLHAPFVPLSQVLPRAAAFVHHGGIGSLAQGLAAGVPQLIMPMAHDQLDNAQRAARLGVARSLLPGKFRGPAVAERLQSLLDSADVLAACRRTAERFVADDALSATCAELEAL